MTMTVVFTCAPFSVTQVSRKIVKTRKNQNRIQRNTLFVYVGIACVFS